MIKRYGIELSHHTETGENTRLNELIFDKDGYLLIIQCKDYEAFVNSLSANETIEETHSLLELAHSELTDLFSDYGFTSENGRNYLYEETIIPFSIIGGDATEIAMALLQYEEYLIAKEKHDDKTIYFMDKNYKDLIIKVASAYDINVHIFDLDK